MTVMSENASVSSQIGVTILSLLIDDWHMGISASNDPPISISIFVSLSLSS